MRGCAFIVSTYILRKLVHREDSKAHPKTIQVVSCAAELNPVSLSPKAMIPNTGLCFRWAI